MCFTRCSSTIFVFFLNRRITASLYRWRCNNHLLRNHHNSQAQKKHYYFKISCHLSCKFNKKIFSDKMHRKHLIKIYSIFAVNIIAMLNRIFIFPLVVLIRFYQLAISPWLGKNCRYTPTCSQYMLEALKTHGLARGLYWGLRRIGRCHPWGSSGYDPVPPKK